MYSAFLSPAFKAYLLAQSSPVKGVDGLKQVGMGSGLEDQASLQFLCELYVALKPELQKVLKRRESDRKFIDERTRALYEFNSEYKIDYTTSDYKTVLGLEDGEGRIVVGPKRADYVKKGGDPIAPLPEYLKGPHVTLFGPPDNAKLAVNAMNAFHRKLSGEPAIVETLLSDKSLSPKWGADDEDSKTPLRSDLISAGVNLTNCFNKTIVEVDEKSGKRYELQKENLALPIKRFPGLALPSFFLFLKDEPLPLHLYDFAMHFFHNHTKPEACVFYVPKLENEEEARYIRLMMETAEKLIQRKTPAYKMGTIRLMIVLENPRAIFRAHEMMDEMYPYFAGASLGWHDYLASTARLFKEDGNYRIPVKADPNIVINYIKASHRLLADVVGPRGGIKVGGMYGILPIGTDIKSASFQITLKGYFKDVVTQMKRDLTGFWVAHPDFVRLGLTLVVAWKKHAAGDSAPLHAMVNELLEPKYAQEILQFIAGPDIQGLNPDDALYARSLIVADIKESNYIANNHPDEIRYNVFQCLQYLADWLTGNGCVALPAQIEGVAVRVMDDLATTERSRWEVWHEIRHGRFALEDFLRIAHEELHFIRKDLSDEKKIVQVKWDERTAKWYPIALKLMVKLMTDAEPAEFATELLLPFTIDKVRESEDPWAEVLAIDADKFKMDSYIIRFNDYFECLGSQRFATVMAHCLVPDLKKGEAIARSFTLDEINEAASFHGDIGEGKKTLDSHAQREQEKVFAEDEALKSNLRKSGQEYKEKFGFKFLVSAQGKSGSEMLKILQTRIQQSSVDELENARGALWEIALKRLKTLKKYEKSDLFEKVFKNFNIPSAQISLSHKKGMQHFSFGEGITSRTFFEVASLSKSVASAFAIEYFSARDIKLSTSVNSLLEKTKSPFRLSSNEVTIEHLMRHQALNMHYVFGVPANKAMPKISEFLNGNKEYGYPPIEVICKPGSEFHYSGGGYIVLEHLIEAHSGQAIADLTHDFLHALEMYDFTFTQETIAEKSYATGFKEDGTKIAGDRLMFPAFAAGGMGTSDSVIQFLKHLTTAYQKNDGSGPISHTTARWMLFGEDKGCMDFMGSRMGLGVFIAEAGDNRFAVHQGANDGFRCLYLYCFAGPDAGKGLVTLCTGELNGVLFNATVAQEALKLLDVTGIDYSKFEANFDPKNLKQEEVVNIGYRNLVFKAFTPTRAEEIIVKGPLDPLASENLAVGATVLNVTNDKFARAENLFSPYLPIFDPELFGKQGKIMDSWESVRHNPLPCDELIFKMKQASSIRYVSLSTKYHHGNQAPAVRLEAKTEKGWIELMPKTDLVGHAIKWVDLGSESIKVQEIKVQMIPDGGLSRLGLYLKKPQDKMMSEVYKDEIPKTLKPLSLPFRDDIKNYTKNLKTGELVNLASLAFGAKVLSASNEHYGPAAQVISPYKPLNMFDGMESARSRIPGHYEEAVIALAKSAKIDSLLLDFTYFVNNNPLEVSVEGLSDGKWIELMPRMNVKSFAGSQGKFRVNEKAIVSQVKVRTYPCGGLNRVKVFGDWS
ncbi:MAG: serine hydrolase [Bacteriovoracaceae bacterium]|nr:serine hydrolase [Bacteriovoracaceae bacterium]